MKTFDLNAYGVAEMTRQEMLETDGGNIFNDIGNWISNALDTAGNAIEDACEWLGQAAQDVWAFMNEHGLKNGRTGVHS
ncbi:hypothetical protein FACS189426_10680 [Bacteroidia bacterium]|nr:hypothetical protein FACS189426_10680 [Bacteroidia bacterium]GHT87088.1 hypothetical protein FACS18947_7160 [Bacteroidia bacterium]